LAAYRRAIDPPPGASAAIWGAIAARSAAAAPSEGRRGPARRVMITLAIAAAVALGIAAQLGTEIGRERPATPLGAPYASEPARPRATALEAGAGAGQGSAGSLDQRIEGTGDPAAPAPGGGAAGEDNDKD